MSAYVTQEEVVRVLSYLENEVKRAKERLAAASDDSPKSDLKLREATVQDIQLELIRRTTHNLFDGEIVAEDLQRRSDLWNGVILTRPGGFALSGLIPLRDLSLNIWNADTLCIWAKDEIAAQKLAELGETWHADDIDIYDEESTDDMLGGCDEEGPLVVMWWD